MATLGRSKPSSDARAAGRSYLTTSSFNTSIYSYTSAIDYSTNITNGHFSTLSAATTINCPKGHVLRETGRKLYPGINPGVSSLMVSVYDDNTMFNGYIDPNSQLYTVFNSDKASFIPNNNQLGSPVYTRGSVETLEEVIASTMYSKSRITTPVVLTSSILTSSLSAAGTITASVLAGTTKVTAPTVEGGTLIATSKLLTPLVQTNLLSTSIITTNSLSASSVTTNTLTTSNVTTNSLTASTMITNQLYLPTTPGIAPIMGTARLLAGGVVDVNTSACTTTSYIFVSHSGDTTNPGFLTTTIVESGKFRIKSSSATDSSDVNWMIIQPI